LKHKEKESYDKITEEARIKIISLFLTRSKTPYDIIENLLQWSGSQNIGVENNVSSIVLEWLI
jgi:hypothetical protein